MNRISFAFAVLIVSTFGFNMPCAAQPSGAALAAGAFARDYWFPIITNYGGNTGSKYFALYITALDTATVHVQLGTNGFDTTLRLKPGNSSGYALPLVWEMPLAWEMQTSGTAEDKAVHVWSSDTDFACNVMSHVPYTSDGLHIIPTTGWGTEYVVAAYQALFEGYGSYVYDLPSEFAIVASQDSTHVQITPSADLRLESSDSAGCCSCIFATKGQTTSITLNRGQSAQFKTTCVQNCDNFDVTGTVLESSLPIGVVGGSSCPNIPCDFPYCDHVCDMVPPVAAWGRTYYSAPFYQPAGMPPSHSASTFLVIASLPEQIIHRFDVPTGDNVYFISSVKFDQYWRNDIDHASRWTSDAPFLLVQYVNSSSYPDNVNGQGDPAEVVLNPVEEFQTEAIFQSPRSLGNQSPYTNYVNVIVNLGAKKTTLDGNDIRGYPRLTVDNQFAIHRVSNVKPGTHVVISDSAVGVYSYGYGFDESYAWSGGYTGAPYVPPPPPPPPPQGVMATGPVVPLFLRVMEDGRSLNVVVPVSWSGTTRVEIESVLGARVLDVMADGNTIDASALASGVYFYRLTSRGTGILPMTASGKLMIVR